MKTKALQKLQNFFQSEYQRIYLPMHFDIQKVNEKLDSQEESAFVDSMMLIFKIIVKFSSGSYFIESRILRCIFLFGFLTILYTVIKYLYYALIAFAFLLKDIQVAL